MKIYLGLISKKFLPSACCVFKNPKDSQALSANEFEFIHLLSLITNGAVILHVPKAEACSGYMFGNSVHYIWMCANRMSHWI